MELSSLLVRNVNYEIPSLKKQIAKCQQLQQEYSRKEEEGQAGAAEMREQFYHSCKQYGITVSGSGRLTAAGQSLGLALFWAQLHCSWLFLGWVVPSLDLPHLSAVFGCFDLIVSVSHHV